MLHRNNEIQIVSIAFRLTGPKLVLNFGFNLGFKGQSLVQRTCLEVNFE